MSKHTYMSAVENFAERSEIRRRDEERQAVVQGEMEESGSIKDVYQGLRDNKIKVMHESDFDEENHQELTDTPLVANAEITKRDWSDIGYWENTVVVNQQEAEFGLQGAIDEYGVDEVIDMAVNDLLDEFTEEGVVYKDPKDNIGFFNDQPKAFDVYDTGAFMLFDDVPEELSDNDMYLFEGAAANMYKQFAEDIEDKSTMDTEMAMEKVAEESDYISDDLDEPYHFLDSFEYEK